MDIELVYPFFIFSKKGYYLDTLKDVVYWLINNEIS